MKQSFRFNSDRKQDIKNEFHLSSMKTRTQCRSQAMIEILKIRKEIEHLEKAETMLKAEMDAKVKKIPLRCYSLK